MTHVGAIEKAACTGCKLCGDVCPAGAVGFETDAEGFWYPAVDEARCTRCGLCTRLCPVLSPPGGREAPETVIAAVAKDKEALLASASGGVYSVLAEQVLENGGAAAGARYDEGLVVRHVLAEDEESLAAQRESKYVQSDAGGVYAAVKGALGQGRSALFCGTPCQAAAMVKYADGDENLTVCDFVCRGVPSPKVFRMYLDWLGKQQGSPVSRIQFKCKDAGWNSGTEKLWFASGETRLVPMKENPYLQAFLQYDLTMRPSCHACRFRGRRRAADLTLADFWGIEALAPELRDDTGVSAVLAYSEKGESLFADASEQFTTRTFSLAEFARGNFSQVSPQPSPYRGHFFRDIDRLSFGRLIKKYARQTPRQFARGVLRGSRQRVCGLLPSVSGRLVKPK